MSQEISRLNSLGKMQSHTKEDEFISERLLRLDCKREAQCFNPGVPGSILCSVPAFKLALSTVSDQAIYQTCQSFTEVYLNRSSLKNQLIESIIAGALTRLQDPQPHLLQDQSCVEPLQLPTLFPSQRCHRSLHQRS